jgi:hypothetical protein
MCLCVFVRACEAKDIDFALKSVILIANILTLA